MIVSVAATQMQCTWDESQNLEKAENLIEKAAGRGANIVLLQELFSTPYFCPEQKKEYFSLANEVKGHPYLKKFSNFIFIIGAPLVNHKNNFFLSSFQLVPWVSIS